MDQVNRRQAREQAFALLFELSFHPDGSLQDILDAQEDATPDGFAVKLVCCVQENLQALDDAIVAKLKPGWRLSRISRASHAILRLAICEICYFEDIPAGASINEAVELAKLYADDDAPKFINGILGAIVREQKPELESSTP